MAYPKPPACFACLRIYSCHKRYFLGRLYRVYVGTFTLFFLMKTIIFCIHYLFEYNISVARDLMNCVLNISIYISTNIQPHQQKQRQQQQQQQHQQQQHHQINNNNILTYF